MIASYLVRIVVFFYTLFVFLDTVNYFVNLKKLVLESQLLSMSCFNYLIISVVYLLAFVRMTDTLTTDIITVIRLSKDVYQDRVLEFTWLVCRLLVLPLRDLFELLMICYMIYYQDQRQ